MADILRFFFWLLVRTRRDQGAFSSQKTQRRERALLICLFMTVKSFWPRTFAQHVDFCLGDKMGPSHPVGGSSGNKIPSKIEWEILGGRKTKSRNPFISLGNLESPGL